MKASQTYSPIIKRRILPVILLSLLILGSCNQSDYTQEAADIPVIASFLVPGQLPVVRITKIIPYAAEEGDTLATPISDLQVFLKIRGMEYLLAEDSAGSGNYQMEGGADLIKPADTIELHTEYKGIGLSATTVVPSAPANLSMSTDVLYYSAGNPSSWLSAGQIDLNWTNPEEDFYYITVQNIETNPVPLNDMAENMPRFGSSSPSRGDQFRIGMRNVTYLGTHQVIIYHVNREFAELFDNPGMSAVALSEPPTNISSGLGIFTAMNPDTLYFEVRKK